MLRVGSFVRLFALHFVFLIIFGLLLHQPIVATGNSTRAANPLADQSQLFLPLTVDGSPIAFVETFDGEPASPRAYRSPAWDVTVHSRDVDTWFALEPMQAQHGADCGPPSETHTVTAYADAVYQCRNHLMTAINAGGYGAIYLTPNQFVDFSSGEAVIRWDMSTFRSSQRDWVDLWITPYEEQLQLPLQDWLPDLNGEPRRAVHVVMDNFNGETIWRANVVRDHEVFSLDGNWWTGYEQFLTPDKARRDTFEVRISETHLRVGMPAYNFWWIDTSFAALGWTQGVVQFGHHSYNPTKDCDVACGPNTWHWDTMQIEPSVPFTMIQAEQAYALAEQPDVTFESPVPEGARLRFVGIGDGLEVSFDGGAGWEPARIQPQEKDVEEAFSSYFMPIPAGTTSVRFRGQDWWGGPWMVRSISIWSR
jgi:hypothetical protein